MNLRATFAASLLLLNTIAFAQTKTVPAAKATTSAAAPDSSAKEADSRELRENFKQVLQQYPPEVGKVLKLDPMLLANTTYLATYPELATFVAQHPAIAHSPHYYLENVWIPGDTPIETSSERVWRDTMQGLFIFAVLTLIALAFGWLIRTVIEHRRWTRLSRVQAEVHNKLLDRLTSNDELLAYIQTSAGRRFLESAPLQIDSVSRPVGAPVGRILWSAQLGLVVAAAGIGLQYVSGSVDKNAGQPLLALGVVALCVGAGFVLSSVVSYVISRRLGLLDSSTTPAPAE